MPSFLDMLALFKCQHDKLMLESLKVKAVKFGDPGMVTLKNLMEPALECSTPPLIFYLILSLATAALTLCLVPDILLLF